VFDRPQRLVVTYGYDLPIAKGKQGFEGKALVSAQSAKK